MDLRCVVVEALRHTDKKMVTTYVRTGRMSDVVHYRSHGIDVTTETRDWSVHSMSIRTPTYRIWLSADQPVECDGISYNVMRMYMFDVLRYPVTSNIQSYLLLRSLCRELYPKK